MFPQVTVYGSWKFISVLTIPLCVKLTSLLANEDRESSPPLPTSPALPSSPPSSLPSPSSISLPCRPFPHADLGIEKTLTVHPGKSSPSILGPKRELGGVVLRTLETGSGTEWSSIYPLPCEEGWTKPHLLVEVCQGGKVKKCSQGDVFIYQLPGGSETQFWFSVQAMDKTSKPWGHKVSSWNSSISFIKSA